MTTGPVLAALATLAREAGAPGIAAEAEALSERLGGGRFYVVCLGQFKRGKSTLLNALVGVPVLPVGVVPITTAVTVVRHGDPAGARVRVRGRDWEACDPAALVHYVSEEYNPGNEKAVTAVEVFVPSPLLRSGLCLVDTPGIGSVSLANTEATRAFVPHVDAALLVLGADPPITGDELHLVSDVSATVNHIVVVLNKADRQSDAERAEVIGFTRRVLEANLHRPVEPILEVSATERLIAGTPTRDWDHLVARLEALAREAGADLVNAAEARETRGLADALLRDVDEQRQALIRPLEESGARVTLLRTAVADAQRTLAELDHLLTAEQERLARRFTAERDAFFAASLAVAQQELRDALRTESTTGPALRGRALAHTREVMRRWIERWRHEQEPRVETLYQEAERRFVELANAFQARLAAVPGLETLSPLEPRHGFRARARFYHTDLMHAAPTSAVAWILDLVVSERRTRRIERAAGEYLGRLLDVNSARMKNAFDERVLESRRLLEGEIRERLRQLADSAERALLTARQARAAGCGRVRERLQWLDDLSDRVQALGVARSSRAYDVGSLRA